MITYSSSSTVRVVCFKGPNGFKESVFFFKGDFTKITIGEIRKQLELYSLIDDCLYVIKDISEVVV